MSKKSESTLVRNIVQAVKYAWPAAYVRKLSDRFQRGLPDLIIVFSADGSTRFLAVEVKTETGKASPLQVLEASEINAAGGVAILARSVDDVLDKMREMTL